MKVKSQSEVAQSCPTLSDAMDCSLPGSSVHGIFQARVLEWGAIAFISPSKEYSGLISFKMDWLDLLAVQGTPKSLLQHHSSKASILQHSAFFIVQLSRPYMPTGKTIALTLWTSVNKVMSLLFKYAIYVGHSFSSKEHLLISWLKSPAAVILEPKKIKPITISIVSPFFAMK